MYRAGLTAPEYFYPELKLLVMGKYTYKPQYGVIVICTDEKEQQAIYERLKAEGLTLKVVSV